ncbi:hypothetical protein Acy02nite_16270 [Actinoplanes cyaneus]|uniref:SWIM-type domain-containing protein n=1 Tax=Actinoplanes cyaneus TaxID=52696 RepID=A0A919IG61_9ACTN|nr:hypothetical protein [Actinoplanes cyaneus]MCW2142097.1 hypothetical protein [Actinoplanes cyaneus]GID63746.1 hypothetical protein Acy02nite_16270 [Actinoplanes cyaneus]
MSLPPVAPAVAAEAVAALPARLRKRLDEVVAQVTTWAVEVTGDGVTVRPDEQVAVTLKATVRTAEDAVCGCLLAPRCLHRAAVLNAAPVLTESPTPAVAPAGAAQAEQLDAPPVTTAQLDAAQVTTAQLDAAHGLWEAAAAVLANGLPGAGAVTQADLLRAVHQARATGLHGPAAAAIRLVERLRAGRRDDPAFRLAELTDDLREVLVACHRLKSGDGGAAGSARRDYEPVGDLRLYGLFCEPVRAATGHAGAATYLADASGRLWVISDVRPAERPATASAVRAPVDLGDVRLSHHELARAGLRAVNAHASATGRLSHGRARQAVSASGAGWFEPPLDALWQVPPAEQAARWLAAAALPALDRPAPHDLAFLDGVILGAGRHGLLLGVDGLTVAVSAPHGDPALPYVSNLRLLAAHAPGRRVRLIGRFTGPRRVDGLAVAASWLPAASGGHVDLGATALTRTDLPDHHPSPTTPPRTDPPDHHQGLTTPPGTDPPGGSPNAGDPDRAEHPAAAAGPRAGSHGRHEGRTTTVRTSPPLHLLRHQIERVAAAGRAVLLSGVDHDARRLAEAHLATAGTVLTALGAAGTRRTRDVFGRLDPHDTDRLAKAWLAAAVFEHAAGQESTRQSWAAHD